MVDIHKLRKIDGKIDEIVWSHDAKRMAAIGDSANSIVVYSVSDRRPLTELVSLVRDERGGWILQ